MRPGRLCGFVLIAGLAVVSSAASSLGARQWLGNSEITVSLAGKTLEGRYASGRPFTERYHADGRVEYIEGGRTTGGRWSIRSATLCTIYDADPAGGCFRVSQTGDNCFEFFFVARTEEAAPGPAGTIPHWTARGGVADKPYACGGESV